MMHFMGDNMKKFLITSLASVVLASGSALAADISAPLPYKAPPPPPPTWTGCYIGGGGGYGMWNQDEFDVSPAGAQLTASNTAGGRGWFGQGQAGCDYQFSLPLGFWTPNVVIGAFGDFEGGSIRGTNTAGLGVGSENEPSAWAVGGRAGLLVTPRVLTYFDGGFTQARFDQINYGGLVPPFAPTGNSLAAQTYNGWFIGTGFEYALDFLPIPGLFWKTEYRYSQFDTVSVPFIVTATGVPTGFTQNSTIYTQMISTEFVWRFNWAGPVSAGY